MPTSSPINMPVAKAMHAVEFFLHPRKAHAFAPSMKYREWLHHAMQHIYATLVQDNIPRGFRTHVFVMRMTGLWPSADHDSRAYKWLTISFFLFVGFVYPFSLFMNVLFANSVEEAMDHLFLSSTVLATVMKAAIVYWRSNSIRDLFYIHSDLLSGIEVNFVSVAHNNVRVHMAMMALYFLSGIVFIVQTFFSPPEASLWPSTLYIPYAFAQQRAIYWIVLVYQMVCGQSIAVWVAVQDAFFIALISTVCQHVAQLKQQLQKLGGEHIDDDRNLMFYKGFVECCQRYEGCLRCEQQSVERNDQIDVFTNILLTRRFEKEIKKVLSLALFVQFGVSGLVICSTVYLLSVVNIDR